MANEWTQTQIDTNMRVMRIMSKKMLIEREEERKKGDVGKRSRSSSLCFPFAS